jgi:hypothetical protein
MLSIIYWAIERLFDPGTEKPFELKGLGDGQDDSGLKKLSDNIQKIPPLSLCIQPQ